MKNKSSSGRRRASVILLRRTALQGKDVGTRTKGGRKWLRDDVRRRRRSTTGSGRDRNSWTRRI
eukprot:1196872-Pleurochrysis_carterae.AAC.1